VAAIAGLAVIAVIERDGLLEQAKMLGDHVKEAIVERGHPLISGVRGRGLLQAVILEQAIAPAVVDAALAAGFVINAPRPDVLRLAPPLIIGAVELDSFVNVLPALIDQVTVEAS
jgi:acetylornithine aminotransferase